MNKPLISASILSSDFSNLSLEVEKLTQAGIDMLHFDVMDGHFVNNITFGAPLIKSLRDKSSLIFDTHLMIADPLRYIDAFTKVGSDIITVHVESTPHIHRVIQLIKSNNIKAGISLNPGSDENILKYLIEDLDLILIMSVNPGFSGQEFINNQVKKIQAIRSMIDEINPKVLLSVDGGIDNITAKKCIDLGADVLVSGSYIFSNLDYKHAILNLKNA